MSSKDPQSVPKHFLDRFEKIEKVDFFTFFHRFLTLPGHPRPGAFPRRLPWAPCIQTACIHRGHWASPVQVPFWRGVKPWKSGSRGKNDVWGAERCLVCPPRTPKVFPNTFWIDWEKSKNRFFHRFLGRRSAFPRRPRRLVYRLLVYIEGTGLPRSRYRFGEG